MVYRTFSESHTFSNILLHEKDLLVFATLVSIFNHEERLRAVSNLQAGMTTAKVPWKCGVHKHTIRCVNSGRQTETACLQDRQIIVAHVSL